MALGTAGCTGTGIDLDSLTPPEGTAGDVVTLAGSGFCGERAVAPDGACDPLPSGSVTFGLDPQVAAVVSSWRDDQIVARVPSSVARGDVTVVVTVDGRSSNGVVFGVR